MVTLSVHLFGYVHIYMLSYQKNNKIESNKCYDIFHRMMYLPLFIKKIIQTQFYYHINIRKQKKENEITEPKTEGNDKLCLNNKRKYHDKLHEPHSIIIQKRKDSSRSRILMICRMSAYKILLTSYVPTSNTVWKDSGTLQNYGI